MTPQINGRITNYRTGPLSQNSKECLVQFEGTTPGQYIGKKVVWTQGKTQLAGRVMGLHGKNGMVRVKFAHGVPGQAIGSMVQVTV